MVKKTHLEDAVALVFDALDRGTDDRVTDITLLWKQGKEVIELTFADGTTWDLVVKPKRARG